MITQVETEGTIENFATAQKVVVVVEPGTQVILEEETRSSGVKAVHLKMDYGEEGTDIIESWIVGKA